MAENQCESEIIRVFCYAFIFRNSFCKFSSSKTLRASRTCECGSCVQNSYSAQILLVVLNFRICLNKLVSGGF